MISFFRFQLVLFPDLAWSKAVFTLTGIKLCLWNCWKKFLACQLAFHGSVFCKLLFFNQLENLIKIIRKLKLNRFFIINFNFLYSSFQFIAELQRTQITLDNSGQFKSFQFFFVYSIHGLVWIFFLYFRLFFSTFSLFFNVF